MVSGFKEVALDPEKSRMLQLPVISPKKMALVTSTLVNFSEVTGCPSAKQSWTEQRQLNPSRKQVVIIFILFSLFLFLNYRLAY